MSPRKRNIDPYPIKLNGVYGKLGSYNTSVRYLQGSLQLNELDNLSLIQEITGSERWGVRQLFQRNVNQKRVESQIVPYFLHQTRRKFFNPLTIAIMPMDGDEVKININEEDEKIEKIQKIDHIVIEAKNYYKLNIEKANPDYAFIEWNKDKVRLVAIDGQHRLNALKNLRSTFNSDPSNIDFEVQDFKNWRIPIVLIIIKPKPDNFKYLEAVRDIFVTINSNAKRPSRAQLILLDDYSISHICVQEFVDHCQKSKSKIPFVFLDWKAEEIKQNVEHDLHFIRLEELADYHINYIIGENDEDDIDGNLTDEQRNNLEVNQMEPSLKFDDENWRNRIRKRYQELWIPAIEYIFANFTPTKDFIAQIQLSEKNAKDNNNVTKQAALYEIKYGGSGHKFSHLDKGLVQQEIANISVDFNKFKSGYGLINHLIGLRAIFCSFSMLKETYYLSKRKVPSNLDYAKWFVKFLNKAYDNNYFTQQNSLLKHIAVASNGRIGQRYKWEKQKRGYGCFISLVIASYAYNDSNNTRWRDYITDTVENIIRDLIHRGFKPEVRAEIESQEPNIGRKDLIKETEKKAKQKTNAQIKKIKKALDIEKAFDD